MPWDPTTNRYLWTSALSAGGGRDDSIVRLIDNFFLFLVRYLGYLQQGDQNRRARASDCDRLGGHANTRIAIHICVSVWVAHCAQRGDPKKALRGSSFLGGPAPWQASTGQQGGLMGKFPCAPGFPCTRKGSRARARAQFLRQGRCP
jgi:hypothetical protein